MLKFTATRFLPIVAAISIGACSSTPIAPSAAGTQVAARAAPSSAPAAAGAGNAVSRAPVAAAPLPAHLDPASVISKQRSIYFDFDDFSIKPEGTSLLELHAKYLAANSALAVRVEGNADERGSKEYNLSLGQKRAEAVANALRLLGVKATQVEAVSWGEEKPVALGHDEASWAKNRRADIVYPMK